LDDNQTKIIEPATHKKIKQMDELITLGEFVIKNQKDFPYAKGSIRLD